MRSTACNGPGLLGISLGAALAGLVALGGAGNALAQGMSNMGGSGYRDGNAAVGHRNAARPGPAMKGSGYQPKPLAKGSGYRPASRVKGTPRAKRSYYRSAAPKTCGQFQYWSTAKGLCVDARTSPPAL